MNIRLATADDAHVLADLNARVQKLHADAEPTVFKQPTSGIFTPRPVTDILTEPDNVIFLAERGGEPIGYLWAFVRDQPETVAVHAHRWLVINHIAVHPDHQHQGTGTALIQRAKEHARSLGLDQVTLNSWSFNAQAHHFFQTHGFEPFHIGFRTTLS